MGSRDLAGCRTSTMQISTITTLSLLLTPCITSPLQRSSAIRSSLQRRFSRPAPWGLSNSLEAGPDTSLQLPLSVSAAAQELGLAGLRNRQLSVISSLDVLRQQLLQEIQRGGRGRSNTSGGNNNNNNLGRNNNSNNNNNNNNNNLERIG